ncbi:MAG: cytochrome c biogenesis protein CcsA [Tannerellaceae bacterium]|jgi:cytochrome c-type biogenesis protein CcsB|nr:cytochrome c biogenesis protein CcsA [Tannerellaceae bacterium]
MKTIQKAICSYHATIILLSIYACGLAIATFIEKYTSTEMAKVMIYYSPLFFFLQFLLVINFIAIAFRQQLLRKHQWGFMIVHLSFIIILLGALISHLFAKEGILHLREGDRSNHIRIETSEGTTYHTLPFSVELVKFTLSRYPGSSSPSSYESEVLVHLEGKTYKSLIFMNNVLDLKGYRFFQASYDPDEKGTILSVNKDVAGRNVTYTGYGFLTMGFVLCLIGKHSRFGRLKRMLKNLKQTPVLTTIIMLLWVTILPAGAASHKISPILDALQKNAVDPAHAARFGSLPIQAYNGRIMPINTFSSEILRKIHKADKVGKLNSDQFLLSLLTFPEMWMRAPLIALPNKELAHYFDLTEEIFAYTEAFDGNGNYKLQSRLEEAYTKMPAQRNQFDKDLIKLDEQINILYQLLHHQRLNIFPLKGDSNHTWYAPGDDLSSFPSADSSFISSVFLTYLSDIQTGIKEGNLQKTDETLNMIATYQIKSKTFNIDARKIRMELIYNKINIFRSCKIVYLSLGGLLLISAFISLFKKRKWMQWLSGILVAGISGGFLFHIVGMGMRWFIGGYAPWSNSYETMVYVSWASVLAGFLFARRSIITFALSTLFGGVILFVSGLNWMDPQINLLVPVLKSPWLMFHVAIIVAAYGFFGISCLMGITNLTMQSIRGKNRLTLMERIKELTIINEMSLWIGLALMTIGTFLGAIWANESWGRYWGWDPKETWALITIVIYAICLHLRLVKKWDNARLFNLASTIAFLSVLMTYFGVNYFLSGMHSYG